jgi:hypothetical protein
LPTLIVRGPLLGRIQFIRRTSGSEQIVVSLAHGPAFSGRYPCGDRVNLNYDPTRDAHPRKWESMQVDAVHDRLTPDTRAIDRLFYVFLAWLFVVMAVAGFAPRLASILGGTMRNPPLIVHLHAGLMAVWLLLFLAQTSFAAKGRIALHKRVGLTAFGIAPVMVAAMVATMLEGVPAMNALGVGPFGYNMLLPLIGEVTFFVGFLTYALLVRGKDGETHKRMMVLATVAIMPGALDRMGWLPGYGIPFSRDAVHVYQLLLLVPPLAYDFFSRGRPHPAHVAGMALLVAWVVAVHFLWGSAWWLATAAKLMGG